MIVQVDGWQELSEGRLRGQRGCFRSSSGERCTGGLLARWQSCGQSGAQVGRLGETARTTEASCRGEYAKT